MSLFVCHVIINIQVKGVIGQVLRVRKNVFLLI